LGNFLFLLICAGAVSGSAQRQLISKAAAKRCKMIRMGTFRDQTHLMKRLIMSTLPLWLWMGTSFVHGQALEVPIYMQVPLAVKSLNYSKSLPSKLKDGRLMFGICYLVNNARSTKQMEELSQAFSKEQFSAPIRLLKIPLDNNGMPLTAVKWDDLSCVYLTNLYDVSPIYLMENARSQDVISFSTDPKAVLSHVTVAFELIGGRAKFAINLSNAEKEACEFSSQLLKLSKIY
jgi:YfiR/HmsC-like